MFSILKNSADALKTKITYTRDCFQILTLLLQVFLSLPSIDTYVLQGSQSGKEDSDVSILVQTWLPNLEVGHEGARKQETHHSSPPLQALKRPHFETQKQTKPHFDMKLFPSFCFSTCLMRDFWEMKNVTSHSLSSCFFKMMKRKQWCKGAA